MVKVKDWKYGLHRSQSSPALTTLVQFEWGIPWVNFLVVLVCVVQFLNKLRDLVGGALKHENLISNEFMRTKLQLKDDCQDGIFKCNRPMSEGKEGKGKCIALLLKNIIIIINYC